MYEMDIRGKTYMIADTPDRDLISFILDRHYESTSNRVSFTNFSPTQHVNLQAMIDYLEIVNLLTWFISASPQPVFKETIKPETFEKNDISKPEEILEQ